MAGAPLPCRTGPRLAAGTAATGSARRLAIELLTASVIALLLARFGGQPRSRPSATWRSAGVALSQVDSAVQRLPDRLTLPARPTRR